MFAKFCQCCRGNEYRFVFTIACTPYLDPILCIQRVIVASRAVQSVCRVCPDPGRRLLRPRDQPPLPGLFISGILRIEREGKRGESESQFQISSSLPEFRNFLNNVLDCETILLNLIKMTSRNELSSVKFRHDKLLRQVW